METKTVSAEVLNDLLLINNDRAAGYEQAIQDLSSGDQDLRELFSDMIRQSNQNRMKLEEEIESLNEKPEQGTTSSGKIYRAWLDIKSLFTGNDRKTILSNCEAGEDAAQRAYASALEEEFISFNAKSVIQEQKLFLKESHDRIKSLRDAA